MKPYLPADMPDSVFATYEPGKHRFSPYEESGPYSRNFICLALNITRD